MTTAVCRRDPQTPGAFFVERSFVDISYTPTPPATSVGCKSEWRLHTGSLLQRFRLFSGEGPGSIFQRALLLGCLTELAVDCF